MRQGSENQKEKSIRSNDRKKITATQQASDWSAWPLPCTPSTPQEHIFHFPHVLAEKRGQSAESAGHRGDLEDLVVSSVGPLPPKGFSFTPDYMRDSWEHRSRRLWSQGLPTPNSSILSTSWNLPLRGDDAPPSYNTHIYTHSHAHTHVCSW